LTGSPLGEVTALDEEPGCSLLGVFSLAVKEARRD
jgi:hypothetical protein